MYLCGLGESVGGAEDTAFYPQVREAGRGWRNWLSTGKPA